MNRWVWDARDDTTFEKALQWIFYLPLSVAWFVVLSIFLVVTSYNLLRLLCKRTDIEEEDIAFVDSKSLNIITLATLDKYNKARGENKLSFGLFMQSYFFLNWRTDFEPDDVFSQKSAILAHIHTIRTNDKSFVDGAINMEEGEDENFQRMKKKTKQ